jgi:hypothetical protein
MLFGRRKRLEGLAAREAAGESFWSGTFEATARVKLGHFVADLFDPISGLGVDPWDSARGMVLLDEGLMRLSPVGSNDARQDVLTCLVGDPDQTLLPSLLEAIGAVIAKYPANVYGGFDRTAPAKYATFVNTVLREHRISFEYIDGQLIEYASQELHVEVVAPALRLLSRRDGWQLVETAYQAALDQLSKGEPANAITDAGSALQSALEKLGCTGNALGPLIKSAKSIGLIAGHDLPLLHWVSADRSETGDAHKVSSATLEDAWLTVHVVGAILLRLAGAGETRGRSADASR